MCVLWQYKIQYIDYGNLEEVGGGSLVELPAGLAAQSPLAFKVVLHQTRAKDLSDKQVPTDVCKALYIDQQPDLL